uniref:cation:proton antiporter domain-containing protein n=1 Tax=Vogesella oryzae TaxID=1735285 RepID=UPI001583100D
VLRVINDENSSGQVTERVLHLAAFNCVLAVFAFKIIVGLVVFRTSGNLWQATYSSFMVLGLSALLGGLLGVLLPAWLNACKRPGHDSTMAFAIGVICLVMLTHSLKLSPVLATLVFGLVARHRRLVLSPSERGFGVLGELLSVFLFVFIASTLEWPRVLDGLLAGLLLVLVRAAAKMAGIVLFARASGTTWRKGALVGMAMMPISAFVILLLEQSKYIGIQLVDQLAPLAAAALVLEIGGPLLTTLALLLARESPRQRRS